MREVARSPQGFLVFVSAASFRVSFLLLVADREAAREFYRSFGVARESWHYQETPHGPVVIGVTEIADPVAKAQEYAESNRPFDRWFKDQVRNLTGIDPDVQPLGPPSEVIFDTQGETPVYG